MHDEGIKIEKRNLPFFYKYLLPMNKLVLFACILLAYAVPSTAQQKKPVPVKPVAPAAKAPPPYVLKKDYEAQMAELEAKVNAAAGAAASVRRSVEGKLDRVTVLDTQMSSVQEILNSASFQIALTSDSLKETRFSMEEFQKKTDADFDDLHASDAEIKSTVWMACGIAVVIALVLSGIVFFLLNSKVKQANAIAYLEADAVKKSTAEKLEKAKAEMKDDIQMIRSRVQSDLTMLKNELAGNMTKDKEALQAQIQDIINRLTPPEQAEENNTII
jgi:hypothetical protein